jgi:hypothetical protein
MKKILGSSPLSTITGYLLAGLYAYQLANQAGTVSWQQWAIPVAIAILGRVSGDASKTKN